MLSKIAVDLNFYFYTNQIFSYIHLPQFAIFHILFHATFVRDKPKLKKSPSDAALHKKVSMTTPAYCIDKDEIVMDHEVVRSATPNYFQMAGNTAIAGAKRASIPIKR